MTPDEMARARDNRLRRQRYRREAIARANGQPYGLIDAAPIREHLNALAALGWSWSAIARLHGGVTNSQVRYIAIGVTTQAARRMERLLSLPLTYRVPASLPAECTVPAQGAVRRIQSLLALGHTHDSLAPHLEGFHSGRLLRHGGSIHISAENWRRVDRAFRALSTRPGPSDRNRARARSLGYVPPAAWDDIDDPRERPKGVAA